MFDENQRLVLDYELVEDLLHYGIIRVSDKALDKLIKEISEIKDRRC